jgi:choline-sulfatase
MPNAVFLMSDEHNPFVSSIHGHPTVQTPNMERMAAAGTWFENAYCPSPLCLPSRCSFFSGRRVHEVQTYNNCNLGLRSEFPSYGKVLSDQGVYTVHIGKADAWDAAENLEFSELICSKDRNSHDGHIRRRPLELRPDAFERADRYGPQDDPFRGDLNRMDAALGWLRDTAPGFDQPWVLGINLGNPHFPHYVTQELWDMYPDGDDLPEFGLDAESAQHPHAKDLRAYFAAERFPEEHVRGLRRGYLGCVTFIDRQIGRLLDALGELDVQDNTNLFYTADHGEMLGKFGMWWKCSLYEDSVRVPMLAAGPDFAAGVHVDTPVDLLDMQASLFRTVAADRPSEWTGTPLQDVRADDSDRVVFSEYHGHGSRAGAYMVRRGDWKLIYYVGAPNQLFNLADDPNELMNRYSDAHPVAEELETELRRICDPEAENHRADAFIDKQVSLCDEYIDGSAN